MYSRWIYFVSETIQETRGVIVMLELKNLSKSYGKKEALRNINIRFEKGIYGLLGPNGAGKSTLMNVMSDVLEPTTGELLYDDVNIKKLNEDYRSKIGYLPQKAGYYGDFTAEKTLEYFAVLRGVDKKIIKDRIDEVLKMVHLSEHRKEKVKTFSGGMKQRLGIAVTLVGNPEILIFDEPTAGLDPKERLNFRNLMKELASDKTIILSTHIVSDIDAIATYVILLKEGDMIGMEKPENAGRLVKDGSGKLDMNNITLEDVYMFYFGEEVE